MQRSLLLLVLLRGAPCYRLPAGRFPNFHLLASTNIDLRGFSLLINSDVCDEAVVDLVEWSPNILRATIPRQSIIRPPGVIQDSQNSSPMSTPDIKLGWRPGNSPPSDSW